MRSETIIIDAGTGSQEIKIVKRKLNGKEAKLLVTAIKNSPDISGYTVREWVNCSNVFVAEDREGKTLGACMNDDFAKGWTEIAVLFVFEQHRERGIGRAFLNLSLEDARKRNKNVMMLSRNDIVTRMMLESGLKIISNRAELPGYLKKHKLTLTLYYDTRWLMNFYRIFEIIRKKVAFGVRQPFIYGFKML